MDYGYSDKLSYTHIVVNHYSIRLLFYKINYRPFYTILTV